MRDKLRQTMDRFAVTVNNAKSASKIRFISWDQVAARDSCCSILNLTIHWKLHRFGPTKRLCNPNAQCAYNVVKST